MTTNFFPRVVPDLSRLIPNESVSNRVMGNNYTEMSLSQSQSHSAAAAAASSSAPGNGVSKYEDSDLNAIMRSQMHQDLLAYRYDLEFCQTQLNTQRDLSPQEIRTLQIRILDCGHNIRHCKHRIQTLDAQARLGVAPYASTAGIISSGAAARGGGGMYRSSGGIVGKYKRQRVRKSEDAAGAGNGDMTVAGDVDIEEYADADADMDGGDDSIIAIGADGDGTSISPGMPTHTLQRLGHWDCRLCRSRKYLEAGQNRVPSAPCKWPLRDISKLINHFLDLHTEHSPQERCRELGDALARNRGPFEYWLTRTKAQEIEDAKVIDEYVLTLQSGHLPDAMRGLQRAATMFPNTISNSYNYKK